MGLRGRAFRGIVAIGAAAAAVLGAGSARAGWPGVNGTIYFDRAVSGNGINHSVWSMNGDGSLQTRVVGAGNSGPGSQPHPSYDARRLLFTNTVTQSSDINVVNAD